MASASSLHTWALPRLQQLLPLDDDSLQQIVSYADSLPKEAAAEHLKNLLGDEPRSLEFISNFNFRRTEPPPAARPSGPPAAATGHVSSGPSEPAPDAVPRRSRPPKKKANIHALPARQVDDRGDLAGAYQKRTAEEYMTGHPAAAREKHKTQVADNLALRQPPPDASQTATGAAKAAARPPPSAAGPLISDALSPRPSSPGRGSSRTSSPAAATAKVNITGGTAMHGASTALSDLDSAIRSLELQTNPTVSSAAGRRKCSCMATRHALLAVAPNCLACGKIVCVAEGVGPCTFCGAPLLRPDEVQKVLRVLKDERGEERMRANNAAHRRADVAHGKTRALTGREFLAAAQASSRAGSPLAHTPVSDMSEEDPDGEDGAAAAARGHRDRLLAFQASNARRTRVHDEAADFDLPPAGTNMWASPQERALQLKAQQKVLRDMEWAAKPEYEKRKVVASIDLKGGRVVKTMAKVERDEAAPELEERETDVIGEQDLGGDERQGAFTRNPLAKGLIRPVARDVRGKDVARERPSAWRRVQMDDDDNEQWILDGGVYGASEPPSDGQPLGSDEPACG